VSQLQSNNYSIDAAFLFDADFLYFLKRELVVPAGLSQPQEILKDNGLSRKINLFLSVSKVRIIVLQSMLSLMVQLKTQKKA
jgi:hypothetical protein